MKNYNVRRGFMAFQFGDGKKPTYAIGIEVNALKKHGVYNCVIGKEKRNVVVSMGDVERLINKYGEDKVVWQQGKKYIYVIPLNEVEKEKKEPKVDKNQVGLGI